MGGYVGGVVRGGEGGSRLQSMLGDTTIMGNPLGKPKYQAHLCRRETLDY